MALSTGFHLRARGHEELIYSIVATLMTSRNFHANERGVHKFLGISVTSASRVYELILQREDWSAHTFPVSTFLQTVWYLRQNPSDVEFKIWSRVLGVHHHVWKAKQSIFSTIALINKHLQTVCIRIVLRD